MLLSNGWNYGTGLIIQQIYADKAPLCANLLCNVNASCLALEFNQLWQLGLLVCGGNSWVWLAVLEMQLSPCMPPFHSVQVHAKFY